MAVIKMVSMAHIFIIIEFTSLAGVAMMFVSQPGTVMTSLSSAPTY